MIKVVVLFDFFWLTLTLHFIVASRFLVDGFILMSLPRRIVFSFHGLAAREHCRLGRRGLATRLTRAKATPAYKVDIGESPLDDSRKHDTGTSSFPCNLKTWFDISLPEGRCIGIETTCITDCFPEELFEGSTPIESNHWLRSVLHEDEIDLGITLKKSRNSFFLGRLALRTALDFPDYPILRDESGRPKLQDDFFCSVSHKLEKAVAIISKPVKDYVNSDIVLSGVGIDLEVTERPGRRSIAKRILTLNERESLGKIPGITVDEEVLLRFSLKEAIYKAAHPLLRQYVGFQEAEVTPNPDGTASCTWLLDTKADRRIAKLTAHWKKLGDDDYFLTSASVYTNPEKNSDNQK